jgi:hypothetical protein
MSDYYVLDKDGKTPVAAGILEWNGWFQTADRRVAETQVSPEVKVSTVFLGINHQFRLGRPLLFETMIFGGPRDGSQWRYMTWKEAVAGHTLAVDLAVADQIADQS